MDNTYSARGMASWHRPLLALTAGMALFTVVSAIGLLVDDRVLTGHAIWLKPFKFSISIALYGVTLAWMLSLLPRRSRMGEWSGTTIMLAMFVEMAVVIVQVIRGTKSHWNFATPFDTWMFNTMLIAIVFMFVAHVLIGLAVLRARITDRVAHTAVALGLAGAALGALAAVPMDGGHTVGAADGGPGLPLVGWSTVAGDLRVGHFIGLHALQALPLLGWALTRFAGRLSERTKIRLLLVAGTGYAGVTGLTTWQALRGQSLIRPDMLTLTALGILITVLAVTAGLILAGNERRVDPVVAAA